jgi:hypothetical protein
MDIVCHAKAGAVGDRPWGTDEKYPDGREFAGISVEFGDGLTEVALWNYGNETSRSPALGSPPYWPQFGADGLVFKSRQ